MSEDRSDHLDKHSASLVRQLDGLSTRDAAEALARAKAMIRRDSHHKPVDADQALQRIDECREVGVFL